MRGPGRTPAPWPLCPTRPRPRVLRHRPPGLLWPLSPSRPAAGIPHCSPQRCSGDLHGRGSQRSSCRIHARDLAASPGHWNVPKASRHTRDPRKEQLTLPAVPCAEGASPPHPALRRPLQSHWLSGRRGRGAARPGRLVPLLPLRLQGAPGPHRPVPWRARVSGVGPLLTAPLQSPPPSQSPWRPAELSRPCERASGRGTGLSSRVCWFAPRSGGLCKAEWQALCARPPRWHCLFPSWTRGCVHVPGAAGVPALSSSARGCLAVGLQGRWGLWESPACRPHGRAGALV